MSLVLHYAACPSREEYSQFDPTFRAFHGGGDNVDEDEGPRGRGNQLRVFFMPYTSPVPEGEEEEEEEQLLAMATSMSRFTLDDRPAGQGGEGEKKKRKKKKIRKDEEQKLKDKGMT